MFALCSMPCRRQAQAGLPCAGTVWYNLSQRDHGSSPTANCTGSTSLVLTADGRIVSSWRREARCGSWR
jgi:hypothetical protein